MILSHLPILQVILPLLAAPFCSMIRRSDAAWLFAMAVSLLVLLLCIELVWETSSGTVLDYAMGNWQAPIGIAYRIDELAAFVSMVVALLGTVTLLFARKSIGADITAEKQPLFYTLYLLCLAGLLGIIATQDIFNLYVFLEISSLSTYALIALGRDRRALSASMHYLIIGTIGATFLLIGIGLLYAMTGTLNMADIAGRISGEQSARPILAALAFILIGTSIKAALFPLHLWLPNAYAFAPDAVSAFLASIGAKVAIYILLRLIYSVFGGHFVLDILPVGKILMLLGSAAIFSGALVAIFQSDIKRLLAFSSTGQIGYLILGLSLNSAAGLQATLTYLANDALAKGALFLSIGAMAYRLAEVGIPRVRLTALHGLARRMPYSCAAFTLAGLSLIGVPLSGGFIAKWSLATAAIAAGKWPLLGVIVIGAALALVYIGRVVNAFYFKEASALTASVREAPLALIIPAWILVAASWYTGIDTRPTLGLAGAAAEQLMESETISPALALNEAGSPKKDTLVPILENTTILGGER